MPGYDAQRDGPYGEWLRNKGVNSNFGGLVRTERVIDEGRLKRTTPGGREVVEAYQTRQDELGNKVRERSAEMGVSTGQDVVIGAPLLHRESKVTERRQP